MQGLDRGQGTPLHAGSSGAVLPHSPCRLELPLAQGRSSGVELKEKSTMAQQGLADHRSALSSARNCLSAKNHRWIDPHYLEYGADRCNHTHSNSQH